MDNIILRALQKEPARRYATVGEFSEDIRRHLAGFPVSAQADSFGYRTMKFIKRHKAGVLAGSLILLTLLGGIIATIWQAHRASLERARAENRFTDVRELANSLTLELHDAIKDLPGSTPARQLLVKRALGYLDKLSLDEQNNPALQKDIAVAYEKIGDVQGNPSVSNLGDVGGALESYNKALLIRRKLLSDAGADSGAKYAAAMLYNKISQVNAFQINVEAAQNHCRNSIALLEDIISADPQNTQFRNALAASYSQLGDLLKDTGNISEGLEYLQKSVNLSNVVLAEDKADINALQNVQRSFARIGDAFEIDKDRPAALNAYQNSLASAKNLSGASPQDSTAKIILAISHGKLGFTQAELGEYRKAFENIRTGQQILKEIVVSDPQNTFAQRQLACAFKYLGFLYLQENKFPEALDNFKKALSIKEELTKKHFNDIYLSYDIAETTFYIGSTYEKMAQSKMASQSKNESLINAEKFYRQSLNTWQKIKADGKLIEYYSVFPADSEKAILRTKSAQSQ